MNESSASVYQRARRRAEARSLLAIGVVLAAVIGFDLATPLAAWAEATAAMLPTGAQTLSALAIFTAAVIGACELAALLGRRGAAPSADSANAFLTSLRDTAAGIGVAIPTALAVVVAARLMGDWWWVGAAMAMAIGLVAALRIAPVAISCFFHPAPLDRPALTARLSAMAREAGVDVASIETIHGGERSTALVTGFGRSRRIYISDVLTDTWTDDEIAVVVAHELAHHAHHDLVRTLMLDATVFATGFGTAQLVLDAASRFGRSYGAGELAGLPVVAAVVWLVWLASTPVRLAESRRQERLADALALVLTRRADAFGAALRRLGTERLAEERPSLLTRWLFHRHPPVGERLAMAEAFKSSAGAVRERP